MKTKSVKRTISGVLLILIFGIWTALIQIIDVKPFGPNETDIGFASLNCLLHRLTGVNMTLYIVTDWMGLVPLFACMIFACIGLVQLVKRKRILKVDSDILILGVYYSLVIFSYILFEMVTINYRPILINGYLESSYPSSTTLLVLSVMPTVAEQVNRRIKKGLVRHTVQVTVISFSLFMVIGRLICGVHWFSDIIGAVLLCSGLFSLYLAAVGRFMDRKSD